MADRLRVLLVDDDVSSRRSVASYIVRRGDAVREAEEGHQALTILEHESIDVVLSAVRTPKLDGIALTRTLRERSDDCVAVVMSAPATFEYAIAALREGAYDCLPKPMDPEQLWSALNRVRERLTLRRYSRSLCAALGARDALAGVGCGGPAMRSVLETARRASQSDLPVLVTGEHGTGKDLIARAVHGLSARAAGPFVLLNTAGMSEEQTEAELFGAVHGHGVRREVQGKVREAEHGTLLINGLNALSLVTQGKLLKIVEGRSIEGSGDGEVTKIDVRIIAAAGEDLEAEVRVGRFRPELYHRLRAIEIHLPPLRERREDIPHLVENLLMEERERRGIAYRIAPEALSLLMAAPWPENVRELDSVVRASVAAAQGDTIETEHLPATVRNSALRTSTLAEQVAAYECAVLRQALESVRGQSGVRRRHLACPNGRYVEKCAHSD